jgi:FO synthase subunit 1
MTLDQATHQLQKLQDQGVIEILVLSGEVHPHSPRRRAWCQHIYNLCQLALECGFLPHTNAGPLSREEMAHLQQVNVSMGLMVEQVTPDFLQTVHAHAPSKVPQLRIQQIAQAGELGIPFTTGLLLGIGESEADWEAALRVIAHLHSTYGHIQELILQPHSPGLTQTTQAPPLDPERLLRAIALARACLPPDITLQIPPNLVPSSALLTCLERGVRDLGGIGPTDEVNPAYPHPTTQALARHLQLANWHLQPRLPVYPQYDDWLPAPLRLPVQHWRQRLASPIPCHEST